MTKANKASIDIGSNSVLLLIANVTEGQVETIFTDQNVTALGKDLDKTKTFREDCMENTFNVLESYATSIKKYNLDLSKTIITATEASRVATNAPDFYKKVKDEIGFNVQIISGLEEAHFSSKGILTGVKPEQDQIILMDIGGASTELIKLQCEPFKILESFSMPFGSVRCTQWLEQNEFESNMNQIFIDYSVQLAKMRTSVLYGVAGTWTSFSNALLGNKEWVEDDVNGSEFSFPTWESFYNLWADKTPDELKSSFPFLGKRAESLRGGFYLTKKTLGHLGVCEIHISTHGLMYGSILEG